MPIKFKSKEVEPIKIEKEGTTFIFMPNESIRRQCSLNTLAKGMMEWGDICSAIFRESLVGWENLKDENDEDVPFSRPVRDALLDDMEIFTDSDVITVCVPKDPEGEQSQKKSPSTKKKQSRKQ